MNKKTILITGATSGIGKHAALHLLARGHRVIATGRNPGALERLEQEGPGLEMVRLDVTDPASIAAAAAEIDKLTGGVGVDVLVNNAGYGMAAPLSETTDADLRAQYETNVFGLMAVTRAFLPRMMERRAGRILNVSSVGGRVTFPLFGAYNSTKYAVESLSDALRRELRPFGVEVVLIEPGPIKTEFSNHAMEFVGKYRSDSSPYAAIYARADEIKRQADGMSAGPEVISRAIEKAILARRPAARYVAPFSSRLLLHFLTLLPTRWVDALITRATGLTRKGLAAGERRPVGEGASLPG
ncbi:MAG TPA: SDR family oxidoreductase [Haliangiales bacterium]|nr:SDR family oxidoreductase [Haliangiales bacterium]